MMAGHKKSNQLYAIRSGGTGAVTESFLEEGALTAPSLPVFNPVAPFSYILQGLPAGADTPTIALIHSLADQTLRTLARWQ